MPAHRPSRSAGSRRRARSRPGRRRRARAHRRRARRGAQQGEVLARRRADDLRLQLARPRAHEEPLAAVDDMGGGHEQSLVAVEQPCAAEPVGRAGAARLDPDGRRTDLADDRGDAILVAVAGERACQRENRHGRDGEAGDRERRVGQPPPAPRARLDAAARSSTTTARSPASAPPGGPARRSARRWPPARPPAPRSARRRCGSPRRRAARPLRPARRRRASRSPSRGRAAAARPRPASAPRAGARRAGRGSPGRRP